MFTRVDQSIAMAALFTAYHLKVKAIAALTQSGSTALWMSRLNCGVPIYALTPEVSTRYRMTLFRDVYPLMIKYIGHDRDDAAAGGRRRAGRRRRWCKNGDLIVLTDRRADRQARRHQHHEDRQGRRISENRECRDYRDCREIESH